MQVTVPVYGEEGAQASANRVSANEIPGIVREELVRAWAPEGSPAGEELLVIDEFPSERGRPKRVARYELRYRRFKFSEGGTAGHVSRALFALTTRGRIIHVLEGLRREQPNCDWQLVAATMSRVDFRQVHSLPGADAGTSPLINVHAMIAEEQRREAEGGEWRPGGHSATPMKMLERTEHRWWVELVYADLAEGDLVDAQVIGSKDPTRPGWLTQYVESGRDLRKMGVGSRKNRSDAEALIRRFVAQRPAEVAATPAAIVAPEVGPVVLNDHQLAAIREMRLNGTTFAVIGKMLGLEPDDVEKQASAWTPPPVDIEDKPKSSRRKPGWKES